MFRTSHFTLLTGATGLVGSSLTRELLSAGRRVAVVVRPTEQVSAAERFESLWHRCVSQTGRPIPRPVCLPGDVTVPNFGFSVSAQRWVASSCERMVHGAAALKFVGPDRAEDPWKTNLDGTRHALELCRKLGLREFHYISTAYVCGKRQGIIREDELEMGQAFRNDYEHSKYLAERLVRRNPDVAPATIYRPAVIAGDSRTGYTHAYHGIHVYLKLLSRVISRLQPDDDGRRYAPLRLAVQGDERRNVVPVDWVSRVLCHLIGAPAAHGRTFHLAPRIPVTARKFFDAVYAYFNAYGVRFCGPDWTPGSDATILELALRKHGALYRDYELTDPEFDTANLQRFAGHLPAPVVDEAVLRRYLRYGRQDRWGKRSMALQIVGGSVGPVASRAGQRRLVA
jgi:thioester reductase-like protein